MKKLIILVLIVLAVGGIYFSRNSGTDVANNPSNTGEFRPDPSSATFAFDDGEFTLSNGKYESEKDGIFEEITLLEESATGDLNGDNKEDTAVLLARNSGGSGVFVSAAAYVSGPVGYKGTKTIYIGDRISPTSVTISNGVVTVNFLDRREDEPFSAEPTVPTSKQFVFKNGEFVER